jgi:hypothetical protein
VDTDPESDQPPWWRSDDETFAGATPLFEGEPRGGAEQSAGFSTGGATGDDSAVGSAISEGLKLVAAVSAWSDASGLTDTLRTIAAEATEALATLNPDDTAPTEAAPSETAATDGPESPAAAGEESATAHADAPQPLPHESVCDYCPLCRGLEAMRVVQPQMSQGVAESMASLTSALNYALESLASRNQPHRKQT